MIHQAKPSPLSHLLSVHIKQLVKIMAKTQTDADLPRSLVPRENESGEQASRAVFDRQRVREAEVVVGNDVRIDQSHWDTPCRVAGCSAITGGLSRHRSDQVLKRVGRAAPASPLSLPGRKEWESDHLSEGVGSWNCSATSELLGHKDF